MVVKPPIGWRRSRHACCGTGKTGCTYHRFYACSAFHGAVVQGLGVDGLSNDQRRGFSGSHNALPGGLHKRTATRHRAAFVLRRAYGRCGYISARAWSRYRLPRCGSHFWLPRYDCQHMAAKWKGRATGNRVAYHFGRIRQSAGPISNATSNVSLRNGRRKCGYQSR